jgi:thymidylate synthase
MKNGLDEQYISLLKDILENGVEKNTRNGKVLSVFGRFIRYKFKDGKFPLLTTKKMYFKGIVTELLWFLRGDTNIKYLLENDCHIWDGDAYQAYLKKDNKDKTSLLDYNIKFDGDTKTTSLYTKEEFINKIKTDDGFAVKWGDLGRIYGAQWRDWGGYLSNDKEYFTPESGEKKITLTRRKYENGIDQIQNLITKLKTNPDDRRMLVTAWNPDEVDTCVLPPCHYGFQVYTRELSEKERIDTLTQNEQRLIYQEVQSFKNVRRKKIKECLDEKNIPTRAISLMWNQRSCDFLLGIPFNTSSYGLLLEILAKITNMIPDELIGNLGDTHLYLNHIEQAKEQIGRELSIEERINLAQSEYSEGNEMDLDIQLSGSSTKEETQQVLDYYGVPKRTREPYPLPKLNINTEFWLTESGECGVGNLTENFESLIEGIQIDDFTIENYKSHPKINAPLSN